MVETNTKQTIKVSSITAVLVFLLSTGLYTTTDLINNDNTFYCEARTDNYNYMVCEKTSQYYGLEAGKCWNSKLGNKLCKSEWVKVDFIPDEVEKPTLNNSTIIIPVTFTITEIVDEYEKYNVYVSKEYKFELKKEIPAHELIKEAILLKEEGENDDK